MPAYTLTVDSELLNLDSYPSKATFSLKRASVVDSFVIVPDLKRTVQITGTQFNVRLLANTPGSVYEVVFYSLSNELMRAFFIMPEGDANFADLDLLTAWPVAATSQGGGGTTTFLGLTDTPNAYSGQAGKVVTVKPNETGVEFAVGGSGEDGKSAYQSWVESYTTENIYLTQTTVVQLQQSTNLTNNQFITQMSLQTAYEQWLGTDDSGIPNQFITQNNLLTAYNQWLTQHIGGTISQFITENHQSAYQSWLTTNVSNIKNQFITQLNEVYNAYNIYQIYADAHPSVDISQFIVQFNMQTKFNQWVESRLEYLTSDKFAASLKGRDGKSPALDPLEKFWISICARYVPDAGSGNPVLIDPEAPPDPALENDLLINRIIVPTDIFFEQQQVQLVNDVPEDCPSVVMTSSNGFEIREVGSYQSASPVFYDEIELVSQPDGKLLLPLELQERLYVPRGSVLEFRWATTPSVESVKTFTLAAKKKREVSTDTAIVKLSGTFQIHDSIEGWLKSIDSGLRVGISLNNFSFFSDQFLFGGLFDSDFFYTAYSAVATGYSAGFYQNGTATIKNMSGVERELTLVPSEAAGIPSSIDENPADLPANMRFEGRGLVISFAANQGD